MKICTSYEPENMALMSVCTAGLDARCDEWHLRLTKMRYTASLISQDSACSSSGPNNDDSSENSGSGANALPPALSTSSVSPSSSSLSEGLASSVAVPFTLSRSMSVPSFFKASAISGCSSSPAQAWAASTAAGWAGCGSRHQRVLCYSSSAVQYSTSVCVEAWTSASVFMEVWHNAGKPG